MAEGLTSLLGSTVVNRKGEDVQVSSLCGDNKTVGLYFSAHWCPPCRGFTPKLVEFYNNMKAESPEKLEIVFISSDRDEPSFKEYYETMPWLALPFADRDRKNALSKKFKVQGIPTFILLDKQGEVICGNARSKVQENNEGDEFPWKQKPYSEVVNGELLAGGEKRVNSKDALDGKITGIYFSAHWCPPCRAFTPKLIETYKKLKEDGKNFEIVFASSDRDEASFKEYYASMPWLSLPFGDKRKAALSEMFAVEGIPTLVIMDEKGEVISKDGREKVSSDQSGTEFPWYPKPLNPLDESSVEDINSHTCVVLFPDEDDEEEDNVNFAKEVMQESAQEEHKKGKKKELYFLYAKKDSLCDNLKSYVNEKHGNRCLLVLNMQDSTKCCLATGKEVTKDKVKEAVKDFLDGKLNDKMQKFQ